MNGMKEDIRIAKDLGWTPKEYYDFLSRIERLSARDLNALAMQLLNRAVIKLEKGE